MQTTTQSLQLEKKRTWKVPFQLRSWSIQGVVLNVFPNWIPLCLLIGTVSLRPLESLAQTGGLGLWTGVGTEIKLSKAFSIQGNAQVRFSDNVRVTRAYLGELGISYNLTKHWQVSGYYRYTGRLKWDKDIEQYYYRPYHRFYGEVSFDQKLVKRLKIDYRLRYQNQFKDDTEGLLADKSYIRNKVELSYNNTSRFAPFVSADLFYQLGHSFDQVRYKGGVTIDLTREAAKLRQHLDVFAFTDTPIHTDETGGLIVGITYKVKGDLRK